MQPKKGTGERTSTHRVDGETYQVRRLTCGKHDQCRTCKEDGGHLAVYRDSGAPDGQRWQYIGKQLPQADPAYQPPACQRKDCLNPTPRRGQKYCSAKCRVAANRQTKINRLAESHHHAAN